jgi:serine/threonine-protein kinase SRPK3
MSLFSRSSRSLFRRAWKPLHFPSKGFSLILADEKLEEETIPDYVASHFYPIRIGEILGARYQVVGKLGFGITSTVWLARDLRGVLLFVAVVAHARLIFAFSECRHVALKLFIGSKVLGTVQDDELNMYKQIEESSNDHPGRSAIRSLLDSFDIDGPNGRHRCLVHPPL